MIGSLVPVVSSARKTSQTPKIAKVVTGRQKVLARYRSYHGSTYGTMMLTGQPSMFRNPYARPDARRAIDWYLDVFDGHRRGEAYVMDDGRIVEDGNPKEVFANPQQERTKSFLSHVL